jgi:hypothetical protein
MPGAGCLFVNAHSTPIAITAPPAAVTDDMATCGARMARPRILGERSDRIGALTNAARTVGRTPG